MTINLDQTWLMSVFLVAVRLGVVLTMTPVFTSLARLTTVRVLFTLSLSVLLVSGMSVKPVLPSLELGHVVLAALGEIVVGATMAFGIFAAFGAFSLAGKILDIQAGFGIGSVYDPVTRAGAPLFASMLDLVAVAVFFSMDAHHALLRGLAFSLQQVAPGAGLRALDAEPVIRQFGLMFSLGVALIIPVMLSLLLVEVGMAVISRVLPQMNVIVVGVPVKIFAGVAILAITITSLGPVMGGIYASIFTFWEQVLL